MKKFYATLALIIISVIAVGVVARLYWLDDIDVHSTYYGFLASIIIAGVTAIYVILTYGILKTQELDLEMRKQYVIVPDILEVEKIAPTILRLRCVIKNVSVYPASELNVFIVGFRKTSNDDFKYLLGHYALPAIAPQETIEFKPHGLYPPEFSDETLERAMDSYKFPEEIKKKILQEYILTDEFKRDITGVNTVAVVFLAVRYRTVYNATKFLARDFLVYESYKKSGKEIRIASNSSVEHF